LYGRLLTPELSRRRWAADLLTYLGECGLASFQGITRDVAEEDQLTRLSEWRAVPTGLTVPSFDTAAARLSNANLGELRHWRPFVMQPKGPTFRIDVALLGDPAIGSLRQWHPDLGREEETNET
jgi:hypothetical protein